MKLPDIARVIATSQQKGEQHGQSQVGDFCRPGPAGLRTSPTSQRGWEGQSKRHNLKEFSFGLGKQK